MSPWREKLTPLRYNTYYESRPSGKVCWVVPKCGPPVGPNQLEQTLPAHINFGTPVTLTGTDMRRCEGVSGTLEDFDSERCIIRLADALGSRYVAVKMQEHKKLTPLRLHACVRLAEDEGEEVWLVSEYDDDMQYYRLRSLDARLCDDSVRELLVPARGVVPASSFPDVENQEKSLARASCPWYAPKQDRCRFIDPDGKHHQFHLWLPKSFSVQKKYPLLIFLHGSSGESFCSLWKEGDMAGLEYVKKVMIVVDPVCKWKWQDTPEDWVGHLIQELSLARYVDKSRIYICGLSMGGKGAYHFASHPTFSNLFAAIAVVGPHHDKEHRDRLASGLKVPIYLVVSDTDKVCPWSEERHLWRAITSNRSDKAELKIDMRSGVAHTDIKNAIIEGEDMFKWLLDHINMTLL
eukprot:5008341-Amphidinium_carterae.1